MTRTPLALAALVACGLAMISCSSYNNSSSPGGKVTFRAFVSNPLQPFVTGVVPVLNVVNATTDQLTSATVSLAGSNPQPSIMAVSPNKRFTLVFSPSSPSSNSIIEVNNSTDSSAGTIGLPDFTDSMFVAPDNATGYAAVPNAPINGQSPGAVEVLNLSTGGISATLPVPNAHFIVQSHNGNRILAFGDNSNTVTVITPSLIGTSQDPRTFVGGFDHPVWGVFSSDDSTAYILSCGGQCSGTPAPAMVTALDMTTNAVGSPIPVSGATIGLLNGTSLYVAGTPAGSACGTCGTLQVVDVIAGTAGPTVPITDGYHNSMEMGANGQLFVGAHTCSSGCLSIFNTSNSKVVLPAQTGDVTGIQPIRDRSVVYVCQNGELFIYDTTTDKLQSTQVVIHGQAVDVKLVD